MRLTILGGFLGSGKTTWLRHQLHEGRFATAIVIVNEAAAIPVDDALLARAERLHVLAGGCACCDGKQDLLATLRQICNERSALSASRPDEIILETSGLADPAPIADAIMADPMLAFHIVHAKTIVASDALHGLPQLQSDALARRQIEVADELIVTKLDEASAHDTAALIATLRTINPAAEMSGAIKGTPAGLPLADGAIAVLLPEAGTRPEIFPTIVQVQAPAGWVTLTVWLSALLHARGNDVVRVKGVVRTPAGRLLLQSVRKVMQKPEILPEQIQREDDTLVVIGSGYEAADLLKSLQAFARASQTAAE